MLMACMSFGNSRIMASTCLGIPERLWRSAVSSSTYRAHVPKATIPEVVLCITAPEYTYTGIYAVYK